MLRGWKCFLLFKTSSWNTTGGGSTMKCSLKFFSLFVFVCMFCLRMPAHHIYAVITETRREHQAPWLVVSSPHGYWEWSLSQWSLDLCRHSSWEGRARGPRSNTAEHSASWLKLIAEDLVAREGTFVHLPFIRNLLNNFTNFKTPHSPF